MIKCLIFKNGMTLIGEVLEVGADVGDPDCQIINPVKVTDEDLTGWPTVTDQRSIMVHSDSILTIVDPNEKLLNNYKNLNS